MYNTLVFKRTAGWLSAVILFTALAVVGAELKQPVITEPADAQVIDITPKFQRPFLEGKKKKPENPRPRDWPKDNHGRPEHSYPEPVRVVWQAAGENCTYTLLLSKSPEMKDAKRIDCGAKCEGAVDNLNLDTDYYLQVEAAQNGAKSLSPVRKFRTLDRPPRWIRVPGTTNVRDCGGWRTTTGKRVRLGMIFRGAQIDGGGRGKRLQITPEGLAVMKELGIRTDLDLRQSKLAEIGTPLSAFGAKVLNFPIGSYASFLKATVQKYPDCFRAFLKEENYPIYIHCMGGADRTGTLVMLLLGALDVNDNDMLTEYQLTSFSTIGVRIVDRPVFNEYLKTLDTFAPGKSLAEKAQAYWKARGITDEEIAKFREIMLEPVENK
ncbi:MAG: tyrosine-protein phosphatase [Lentisphaeria bacterium]|nr:tyrosine-protein phosphatase [Lentisphaeria bacterium]